MPALYRLQARRHTFEPLRLALSREESLPGRVEGPQKPHNLRLVSAPIRRSCCGHGVTDRPDNCGVLPPRRDLQRSLPLAIAYRAPRRRRP